MDAIKFLTKNCGFSCGDPGSEICRARAEIEAMAAEAAWYRWLRDTASKEQIEQFVIRRGTRLAADRVCAGGIGTMREKGANG